MNHEGSRPPSQQSKTPVRTSDQAAPRDRRLVHRLSQMTLETDLPWDLEHITSPRVEIIHQSDLARYWSFMTDPTAPPPLPVPRSIMEPGSPGWTAVLLEEFHLARGSKNSLESDYGGENHDNLGIFQSGHSAKHILVTHVDRTGDFYAENPYTGRVALLGIVTPEFTEQEVHQGFEDWADGVGPGRPLSWFQEKIAAFNSAHPPTG